MAKLAVTVLFFLVAVSHARTPFDQTENEVPLIDDSVSTQPDPVGTVPDPDSKTVILLPSEKPESEPAIIVALKPQNTEPESESEKTNTESKEESKKPKANSDHAVTVISFRPINRRQFIKRSWPLSVRHAHRCHLHRGQRFRQWGLRSPRREIPYGNDMIVNGEDLSFVRVSEGGDRQIPARLVKPYRVDPKNSYGNEMDVNEEIKRPHHHHHHHHHRRHHHDHGDDHREGEEKDERDHDHRHHDHEHEHEHKHEGGFVMKIRKFLNQF